MAEDPRGFFLTGDTELDDDAERDPRMVLVLVLVLVQDQALSISSKFIILFRSNTTHTFTIAM